MRDGRRIYFGKNLSICGSVVDVWPQLSLLGAGIGVGSNAATALSTGATTFLLGENECGRIVLEAGILGVLYIAYRAWLVFYLLRYAILATKRSRNRLPILLIGFASVNLLVGQMTLQGTINGYGWLFAGFCIAANRLKTREKKKGSKPKTSDLWC